MASPEPIPLTHYHYRVSRFEQQERDQPLQPLLEKIKPTDGFLFYIDVILGSQSTDSNSIATPTTLFRAIQRIGCKSFFQEEGQDFLRSNLTHPLLPPEVLDQLIPRLIPEVQQLFVLDENLASDLNTDHQCNEEVFHLYLQIVVAAPRDSQLAVGIEQSMLQDVRMIPASKKAVIELLKKIKVKEGTEQIEECSICMEKFDVGDDGVSAMPCNHVFHQECIVQWLQTCHVYPLCRYPMPLAHD